MREVWAAMREGYQAVRGEGQYIALFFVCLIGIAFYGERKERRFWCYSLAVLLALFFPPSVWLLLKYQTGFYSYGHLWTLLPMIGMTSYGAVVLVDMALNRHRQKMTARHFKYHKMGLIAIFGLVVLLAGGGTPAHADAGKAENSMKMPEMQKEVLEWIYRNTEEPCIYAPQEVLEYGRAYSGDIRLLYGRNMWEPSLNAYTYDKYPEELVYLYAWMERQLAGTEEEYLGELGFIVETARQYGCNVLVLEVQQEEVSEWEEKILEFEYFEDASVIGNYLIMTTSHSVL